MESSISQDITPAAAVQHHSANHFGHSLFINLKFLFPFLLRRLSFFSFSRLTSEAGRVICRFPQAHPTSLVPVSWRRYKSERPIYWLVATWIIFDFPGISILVSCVLVSQVAETIVSAWRNTMSSSQAPPVIWATLS